MGNLIFRLGLDNRRHNRELFLLLGVLIISSLGFLGVDLAREDSFSWQFLYYPLALFGIFFLAHLVERFFLPDADFLVMPLTALLCNLGVMMLWRLDTRLAGLQFLWISIGVACFTVLVLVLRKVEVLAEYKYIIALAALLLLFSTFIFGKEVNGARLWLVAGPFRFQPSELAKILLAIFFAAYLADKKEMLTEAGRRVGGFEVPHLKHLGPLLTMWALSLLLLIFQKDLGSSLLFFGIFLALIYVATSRASFVVIGLLLFLVGATCCYFAFAHVEQRVKVWVDPLNPATINDTSYQPAQSLFAIASGGMAGTGLGRGHPDFIPDVSTDFIFSAFAEELGLLGAVIILLCYLLLAWRGLRISLHRSDDFGRLLGVGLTAILALQSFVIIGGVTRLIPLTGITLPFVSYGGSSVFTNFILVGLLLLLSNRARREEVPANG